MKQIAAQPLVAWAGNAWRAHRRVYNALDTTSAGAWRVDNLPEAAPYSLLGGGALLIALHTLNALAA